MNSNPFPDAAATWNKRFAGGDFIFGREPNEYTYGAVLAIFVQFADPAMRDG